MDVVLGIVAVITGAVAFLFGMLVLGVVVRGLFLGRWFEFKIILITFIVMFTLFLTIGFFMPNESPYKDIKSYIPFMSSSAKAPQHKQDTKLSEKFKNSPLLKD